MRMADRGQDGQRDDDLPSADDRADMVVMMLEQFIREGRTEFGGKSAESGKKTGMSFKRWQDLARSEVRAAILNAEAAEQRRNNVWTRVLLTSSVCLITIGFLGGAAAWGQLDKFIAAVCSGLIGIVLLGVFFEWPVRRYTEAYQARQRARKLARIRDLDRQIKVMEQHLDKRKNSLDDKMSRLVG